MRTLRDAELKGKRVLVRVDFNVPRDKEGNIIDDVKMKAAFPTIEYLLKQGAKPILMSHLGRPKGKADEKFSLKKIADHLNNILNVRVTLANDCVGPEAEKAVQGIKPGDVLLLENVRFHPEEEKNDREFSRQLAALGDVFVNDAFGSAHRAHASTAGVADFLPTYAGFLLEKEAEMLRKVLESPECPRMAIMGGAKVADKLGLINNLMGKMDLILIGGGMANTFLKAQGKNIGKSICEEDLLQEARSLLDKAVDKKVQIILPVDVVAAREISAEAEAVVLNVEDVPDDMMILDIGPRSIEEFSQAISRANTIIWNGPMGVYEYSQFARGTEEITRAIASSAAVSVIGGGDTAVIVHNMGLEKEITHISTGGGATLEFLEGIVLPGVAVCEQQAAMV